MTRQKDVFLATEADEWFSRNVEALQSVDWSRDPVCMRLATLAPSAHGLRVLEIGCGDGSRLQQLASGGAHRVFGVDPSEKAVARDCMMVSPWPVARALEMDELALDMEL